MAAIELFKGEKFTGGNIRLTDGDKSLIDQGFNDQTNSILVKNGTWTCYKEIEFFLGPDLLTCLVRCRQKTETCLDWPGCVPLDTQS